MADGVVASYTDAAGLQCSSDHSLESSLLPSN